MSSVLKFLNNLFFFEELSYGKVAEVSQSLGDLTVLNCILLKDVLNLYLLC